MKWSATKSGQVQLEGKGRDGGWRCRRIDMWSLLEEDGARGRADDRREMFSAFVTGQEVEVEK
jgi:hypothetical protein